MKPFKPVTVINVKLDFGDLQLPVGRLAMRDRGIYFEYDSEFFARGLEISPLRLALKPGVSRFENAPFEGLPGVFNDSLPDGWGRLLFDRYARSQAILPADITPLDRLSHVGQHGLGALVYEPAQAMDGGVAPLNLDELALHTHHVLAGASGDVLEELLVLNGSSSGARPKALIALDDSRSLITHGESTMPQGYSPWIVKFNNTSDGTDAGAIEYVYALMAKQAGLKVPDVHLFSSQQGAGYFATKRFDRDGNRRTHMHTACGLLHSDFRTPSLDYEDLLALTGVLTRDAREIEKLYRLAVFNVLSHNRDDHGKNISFLMDRTGSWKLSPAYVLTFSSGPNGEQSTMVLGEGQNIEIGHLVKLGTEAKISRTHIAAILEQTQTALSHWRTLAKEHGVSTESIALIDRQINRRVLP